MHANCSDSAVHVSLVCNKSLAEVYALASLSQDFALEERESRVVPAGTASALVLDACDLTFFDCGEYRLVLVCRFLLLLSIGSHSEASQEG